MKISVSIVLYKTNLIELELICSLITQESVDLNLFLIDNSPTDNLKNAIPFNDRIIYIYNNNNIGFGAAHNIAIEKAIQYDSKYHLVLNSDICFDKNVLPILLQKMEENSSIGMIMPKVLNIDGSAQVLPKLLPSPFNLLIRVIKPLQRIFKAKNKEYTLEDYYNQELNVPILSGCFSLFRIDALKKVGLYDEKFFMYFEDFDISRRIHSKYKTIYYPLVSITHAHERGAAKSFKLFKIFLKSAIIYFNKYGWFIDKERAKINRTILMNL
jgi:GT2 family glycosyltransferase